jgi:hypothetical protein
MKTIELKVAKEMHGGNYVLLTSYDLIKSAINNAPQGGYTPEEMRTRLNLLDKLDEHRSEFALLPAPEKADDLFLKKSVTLELEDAEFSKLQNLMQEMKWGIVSRFIMDTVDQFK